MNQTLQEYGAILCSNRGLLTSPLSSVKNGRPMEALANPSPVSPPNFTMSSRTSSLIQNLGRIPGGLENQSTLQRPSSVIMGQSPPGGTS